MCLCLLVSASLGVKNAAKVMNNSLGAKGAVGAAAATAAAATAAAARHRPTSDEIPLERVSLIWRRIARAHCATGACNEVSLRVRAMSCLSRLKRETIYYFWPSRIRVRQPPRALFQLERIRYCCATHWLDCNRRIYRHSGSRRRQRRQRRR